MIFTDKDQHRKDGYNIKDITIQVTGDCNLACTYCYLHSKNHKVIDIEDGKKFIDAIVKNDQKFFNDYMDFSDGNIDGVALQFIGGEPLCNYKAIIELCDYFRECCERNNREKFYRLTTFGICTNGTIYNKEIEDFLIKYRGKVDLAISIDGNKQLHDTCRVYKDGSPSYDIVITNLEKYRKLMPSCRPINTKVTISPQNVYYIYDSVVNLIDTLGFQKIPMNCVQEPGWTIEHAKVLYQQLKRVADFILEKGYRWNSIYEDSENYRDLTMFNDRMFTRLQQEEYDSAWCGGNGHMLFLQCDGKIYNCNRYSETSVGNPDRDMVIGNIDEGIVNWDNINCMRCATVKSMYPKECLECPVAKGCWDCLAYCYEVYGEFKKVTNICEMHKARALANVYFWNKYYIQHNINKVLLLFLPYSECLRYIDKQEVELLFDISNRRYVKEKIKCHKQDNI